MCGEHGVECGLAGHRELVVGGRAWANLNPTRRPRHGLVALHAFACSGEDLIVQKRIRESRLSEWDGSLGISVLSLYR